MFSFIVLGAILLLALLVKDYTLAVAAGLLALLAASIQKTGLNLIQQYAFPTGIFFLMLFLLMPIASGKMTVSNVSQVFFSPIGIGAILAGFLVSFIGGKGVGVLAGNPVILLGVLIGTLVAVLFTKGLPAGLIIAAGMISIFSLK
nr:DUF441 family protein [uncultured Bacillus sp.]